ncbi:MAG: hypothetical protein JSV19_12215 [Phycisphaerales bacterium]|nr:MAG: hypothetical protein JSV19_12215 [Phycisphaerales bacterium]
MSEDTPKTYGQSVVTARIKRNASQILLPAIVVLVLGWGFLARPESPDSLSDYVLVVLVWTLRIGGIALLGVAGICWTGALIGPLLDAIISSWFAIVLAATAACFIAYNLADLMGYVFAIFAAVYARAAFTLWQQYPALCRAAAPQPDDPVASTEESSPSGFPHRRPEPAGEPRVRHPGSVASDAPDAQPHAHEAPPDGYLADFADDKESPPTKPT